MEHVDAPAKRDGSLKKHAAIGCLLILLGAPVFATPIMDNPAPNIAGDDDGSTLFLPDSVAVSIEILDLGPLLAGGPFPVDGFGGSTFGFYFAHDPKNLITIFDPTDQNPDPGGPDDSAQSALINFLTGEVTDVDEDATQSTFAPATDSPIGFYLGLSDDLVDFFGFDYDTIFTQAFLNPDGVDRAGTFPLLSNPGYLFGFEGQNPFGDGGPITMGLHVTVNVTRVPEPSTAVLLLSGLLSLMLVSRRRRLRVSHETG